MFRVKGKGWVESLKEEERGLKWLKMVRVRCFWVDVVCKSVKSVFRSFGLVVRVSVVRKVVKELLKSCRG